MKVKEARDANVTLIFAWKRKIIVIVIRNNQESIQDNSEEKREREKIKYIYIYI